MDIYIYIFTVVQEEVVSVGPLIWLLQYEQGE